MIVALLAVALGAFTQTTVGFGLGLVSVSFLVAALGVGPAVSAIVFLSLITNCSVVIRERRTVSLRRVALLAAPALATQIAIAPIVHRLDGNTATLTAGIVVLVAAAMLLSGQRAHRLAGTGGLVAAGSVSAAMNMTAGLGGPAAVLYATNANWSPQIWRPTINAFFIVNNLASIVLLDLRPPTDLRLLGAAAIGAGVGFTVADRIPTEMIRRGAIALASAGGVLAVISGLST